MMEDERGARIQRQHSQEMAIRYAALLGEVPSLDKHLKGLIDWFEDDISHSIQLREASPAESPNGGSSDGDAVPLSADQVEMLVTKIRETPNTLHPMIKVWMTGKGVTSTRSLESAVAQLSSTSADELSEYIDSQI